MILVGASGCGKSTALRMVAGLEDISDGELKIDNGFVDNRAAKDRDIAMVFQNYALCPHVTVRENMGFALKLAKAPDEERDRRRHPQAAPGHVPHPRLGPQPAGVRSRRRPRWRRDGACGPRTSRTPQSSVVATTV